MQYPFLATYLHLSFSCHIRAPSFSVLVCPSAEKSPLSLFLLSSSLHLCLLSSFLWNVWAQSFLLFHTYLSVSGFFLFFFLQYLVLWQNKARLLACRSLSDLLLCTEMNSAAQQSVFKEHRGGTGTVSVLSCSLYHVSLSLFPLWLLSPQAIWTQILNYRVY